MKRALAMLLVIMLCLSLAACAAEESVVPEMVEESSIQATEAQVHEVEITLENWQDYFEMRETQWVQVNENGSIILREFGYGVFLKDEYKEQLAEEDPVDVSFEMEVDSVRYQVYGDLTTDNFIIREDTLHNEGKKILTAPVQDLRGSTLLEPGSEMHDAVAAFFMLEGEFGA